MSNIIPEYGWDFLILQWCLNRFLNTKRESIFRNIKINSL